MAVKRTHKQISHDNNESICGEGKRKKIKLFKYFDKYDKSIFIAGQKEIHFNAHIDSDTITRIKKLISEIVDEHKHLLVKYDNSMPSKEGDDFNITYIVNSGWIST